MSVWHTKYENANCSATNCGTWRAVIPTKSKILLNGLKTNERQSQYDSPFRDPNVEINLEGTSLGLVRFQVSALIQIELLKSMNQYPKRLARQERVGIFLYPSRQKMNAP